MSDIGEWIRWGVGIVLGWMSTFGTWLVYKTIRNDAALRYLSKELAEIRALITENNADARQARNAMQASISNLSTDYAALNAVVEMLNEERKRDENRRGPRHYGR